MIPFNALFKEYNDIIAQKNILEYNNIFVNKISNTTKEIIIKFDPKCFVLEKDNSNNLLLDNCFLTVTNLSNYTIAFDILNVDNLDMEDIREYIKNYVEDCLRKMFNTNMKNIIEFSCKSLQIDDSKLRFIICHKEFILLLIDRFKKGCNLIDPIHIVYPLLQKNISQDVLGNITKNN